MPFLRPLPSAPLPAASSAWARLGVLEVLRSSALFLLVLALLGSMLVALPRAARADDGVGEQDVAVEEEGAAEPGVPSLEATDGAGLDDADVDGGADDGGLESEDAPGLEDPDGEGLVDAPEPIALEDLLLGEEVPVGDGILRPSITEAEPTNVSIGGPGVSGFPGGMTYGPVTGNLQAVEAYVPSEEYWDVPWHQLTTRVFGTGQEVEVGPFLIVNRSPLTPAARVTNVFFGPHASGIWTPTNLSQLPRYPDLPSESGTGSQLLLRADMTVRDLLAAGVNIQVASGLTHQHLLLHVLPSAPAGVVSLADRNQGRFFHVFFRHSRDPLAPTPPPSVTGQPSDVTVSEGEVAEFSAAGSDADSQQWQSSADEGQSWQDVAGATGTSLSVGPVTVDMDGALYRVVFTNSSGAVESSPARLTVVPHPVPVVVEHPVDVSVSVTRGAEFSASAESMSEMAVRWQRAPDAAAAERGEWVDIDGATAERYQIGAATLEMDGSVFRAVFTNASGSVASDAATLSVWMAPGAMLSVTPRAVYVAALTAHA